MDKTSYHGNYFYCEALLDEWNAVFWKRNEEGGEPFHYPMYSTVRFEYPTGLAQVFARRYQDEQKQFIYALDQSRDMSRRNYSKVLRFVYNMKSWEESIIYWLLNEIWVIDKANVLEKMADYVMWDMVVSSHVLMRAVTREANTRDELVVHFISFKSKSIATWEIDQHFISLAQNEMKDMQCLKEHRK